MGTMCLLGGGGAWRGVGRSGAVVSTTAVAGAAVAGMKFSAVSEVYSSAFDDEGAPLVIRASEQRRAVIGAGPVWPGVNYSSLVDGMTVPEPIEYSFVGVPNEVDNILVDSETVPDGMTVLEPIEHSVGGVPNEKGNSSVDSDAVPDLIEHSTAPSPVPGMD